MTNKEVIFVLGGPGSGKGTQTQTIANDYGIGYLSTGDLLRAATAAGKEDEEGEDRDFIEALRETMKSGQLVSDETIMRLVKNELEKSDKPYFFLDGFPRTVKQAELFTEQIGECRAVLFLDVPDVELKTRLLKRGETSGRADDNEESILQRLATYHEQSYPVIEHYEPKGKVVRVNGLRTIDAVKADILYELRKMWEIPEKEGEPQRQTEEEAAEAAKERAKQEAEKVAEQAKSKCCLLI